MKLVIFGASGGTGKILAEQSLKAEHVVTAFVRTPAKLGLQHEQLSVVQGDVLDPVQVARAMIGQDAVMINLGTAPGARVTLRTEGTRNIIAGMKAAGVERLVCQTSLGFGDSVDVLASTSFVFRNVIVPFVLKGTFADHAAQEALIKSSGLKWTIVRPGNMTNGKLTATYHAGFPATAKGMKIKVSRADVAHFMLRVLGMPNSIGMTQAISY
jgi:putative NADH-flavin reductase